MSFEQVILKQEVLHLLPDIFLVMVGISHRYCHFTSKNSIVWW